jgi:dihydroneopterin aldolase
MQSDDLDATVNYAHIYEAVEKEMTIPSRLLEHVAGRIIDALKNRFAQIEGGRIAIYKETPPITGMIDRVGVVVEW